MILKTDNDGNVLIHASGEKGRVVCIYENPSAVFNRIVIVVEHAGHGLYTTDQGRVPEGIFNAGKTAGILIVSCLVLLVGCCCRPAAPAKPVTIHFDASEDYSPSPLRK